MWQEEVGTCSGDSGPTSAPTPPWGTGVLPGGWTGSLFWLGCKGWKLGAPEGRKRLSFQRYRGKDKGGDCLWLSNQEPKDSLVLERCFQTIQMQGPCRTQGHRLGTPSSPFQSKPALSLCVGRKQKRKALLPKLSHRTNRYHRLEGCVCTNPPLGLEGR